VNVVEYGNWLSLVFGKSIAVNDNLSCPLVFSLSGVINEHQIILVNPQVSGIGNSHLPLSLRIRIAVIKKTPRPFPAQFAGLRDYLPDNNFARYPWVLLRDALELNAPFPWLNRCK